MPRAPFEPPEYRPEPVPEPTWRREGTYRRPEREAENRERERETEYRARERESEYRAREREEENRERKAEDLERERERGYRKPVKGEVDRESVEEIVRSSAGNEQPLGPVRWVRERTHFRKPKALAYERGAAGWREGEAPELDYRELGIPRVTGKVRFDGIDENGVLIDRKSGVAYWHIKLWSQLFRQSVALTQNNRRARWEVPTEEDAEHVRRILRAVQWRSRQP